MLVLQTEFSAARLCQFVLISQLVLLTLPRRGNTYGPWVPRYPNFPTSTLFVSFPLSISLFMCVIRLAKLVPCPHEAVVVETNALRSTKSVDAATFMSSDVRRGLPD